MGRILVIMACGFSLSACNSGWSPSMPNMPSLPSIPSFDSSSFFGPQRVAIKVETNPRGAEASTPSGGSCRTPCSLEVKTKGDFVVNLALPGHQPEVIPVKVLPPEDPRFASEGSPSGPRLDPDQISVELTPVAPSPARRTSSRQHN